MAALMAWSIEAPQLRRGVVSLKWDTAGTSEARC
jgi:hypothetical protein